MELTLNDASESPVDRRCRTKLELPLLLRGDASPSETCADPDCVSKGDDIVPDGAARRLGVILAYVESIDVTNAPWLGSLTR